MELCVKFNEYLNEWLIDVKLVDYINRILFGVFGVVVFIMIFCRGFVGAVKFVGALVGSMLTFGVVGMYMGVFGLVVFGCVVVVIEDVLICVVEFGNCEDLVWVKGVFLNMIVRDAVVLYKE